MIEVKLKTGKSIQVAAQEDGNGLKFSVKTLFGTFSDPISEEEAGGIMFAIEQAFEALAVIRARDALKHANTQH